MFPQQYGSAVPLATLHYNCWWLVWLSHQPAFQENEGFWNGGMGDGWKEMTKMNWEISTRDELFFIIIRPFLLLIQLD